WLLSTRRDAGRLSTCAVNVTEIAGGMRTHERRAVNRLLSSLYVLSATERIGWRAAELMRTYRRSHSGIGLGDYLVAATADVEGLRLATLNVRHFPMFPGLRPAFDTTTP